MIYGHQKIISLLSQAVQNKTLGRVLLFSGPESIGKKKIAFMIAKALLCKAKDLFCEKCLSCRQVEENKNPSVLLITPSGLYIKIDTVSKIRSFVYLQSFSPCRVVIIDSAHSMNIQTQNALLKSLEEPPPEIYFILVSSQPEKLLPTIRSRTSLVQFNSLSLEDMKHIFPEEEEWVLKASQGQINRIHQWKDEPVLYREIFQFWPRLIEGKGLSPELKNRLKERKTALLTVRSWQEILRDARFAKEGSKKLIHQNQFEIYSRISKLPGSLIDKLYQESLNLEKDLMANMETMTCFENYRHQSLSKIKRII